MDIVINIFEFIFDNILAKPEYFIGLLVFIGYIALGRSFVEGLSGFIKAAIGFMILSVGIGGMVSSFTPILEGLLEKYELKAAVIDSNFGFAAANAALGDIGSSTSLTMVVLLVAFIINILLVLFKKYTKVRTVFITGHIMVKQSAFLTWMVFFALPAFRNIEGAIIIGILIGTYWAVFSNLTLEATDNLIGERSFAVGHSQMAGIWVVDKIAGKLGNKEDSIDNLKLPKSLSVMTDNIIGTSGVMLMMFGTILLVLGQDTMAQFDPAAAGSTAYITYVVSKALSFSVYFIILQSGVKMFVAELMESFVGISDKILKGSVPAVDCAATFGFASPNTVLIGFIFGTIGQITAILGLLVFQSPIMIISGFVPLFFDNATLAIFANKRGGRRAAMIVTVASGMVQVLGGAIGVALYYMHAYGGWYGNLDFTSLWVGFGFIINNLGLIGAAVVFIILLIIPQLQYRRNKENYFQV